MYRNFLFLFVIFLLLLSTVKAEVSEESALLAIGKAEVTVNEMLEMGFGVTYANDTLNEARNLFDQGYYEASELLAERVLEIKEKAIEVDGLIDQVESKIYELSSMGYNVSSVSAIFNSGLSEFGIDNYLDAEKLIRQALNEIDELEAEESLKRIGISGYDISFVLDYLWILIILSLFIMIAGIKVKKEVDIKNWKRGLKSLEKEMDKMKKSFAATQRKYFEKGSVSRMDYGILVRRYNNNVSVIKRKISVLNDRLKNH